MQLLFSFVSTDAQRIGSVEFWSVHGTLRSMTLDSWVSVNAFTCILSTFHSAHSVFHSFIYFFSGDECWKLTKNSFTFFFVICFHSNENSIFHCFGMRNRIKDTKKQHQVSCFSLWLRVTETLSNSLIFFPWVVSRFFFILASVVCLFLIISLFRSWRNWQWDKLSIGKRHKNDTCQPLTLPRCLSLCWAEGLLFLQTSEVGKDSTDNCYISLLEV